MPSNESGTKPTANTRQVGGDHYKKQGIQHWDYIIANRIPYMEAQVIKYLSRWRDKNGLEDLRKAQHYLEKLIESEESTQRVDPEDRSPAEVAGTEDAEKATFSDTAGPTPVPQTRPTSYQSRGERIGSHSGYRGEPIIEYCHCAFPEPTEDSHGTKFCRACKLRAL